MRDERRMFRPLMVGLTALLGLGVAPFSCENSALNSAGKEIETAFQQPLAPSEPIAVADEEQAKELGEAAESEKPDVRPEPKSIQMLSDIKIDKPEIYLGRGLGRIAATHWAEAKRDLDHAYALVAQEQARANALGEEKMDAEAEAHRQRLRARIAFGLGRVAVAEERYEDAIVEFGRVLRDDPFDDDARWNLELAWHMQNPSCLKRDDDHEPDDSFSEAKPYDPEKGMERLLCPKDEDWYAVDIKQPGGGVFATIKGELVQHDGDETREPILMMYGDDDQVPLAEAKLSAGMLKVGQRTLTQTGVFRFVLKGEGTGEFAYEVSVEEIPPCEQLDDDHEPDNDPGSAKPIGKGQNEKRILCPNNQDWYSIQGEKEMDLYIRVRGEVTKYTGDERRRLALALFGPDMEKPLAVVPMKDDELRLGIQGLEEDGTYVFGIWGEGDGEYKYDMDIVVTPPCPEDDAREENDEIQQAYALKDESPPPDPNAQGGQPQAPKGFEGTVGNLKACPDDADYYRLTVPAETEVNVTAIFDAKRAPLVFERIKSDGTPDVAQVSKEGKVVKLPKEDKEKTYTFLVKTETDKENNYLIRWAPPQEDGDQDQQQEQDQQQQQDQDDQDKEQQEQQKQASQPQGLSGDDLLDALDQQDRNPQLEKALRERRVVPDLEDY